MTGVLDYTAFPGIIDSIIAFAPVASLISLRGTSRAFRDRVDGLLLPHVALELGADSDIHLVSAGRGPRTALPYRPEKVLTADLRVSDPSARLDGFSALRTLRRVGAGVVADLGDVPQVTTLVDFYDLREVRPGQGYGGGLPSLAYPFPGLQRYVLHLRVDAHSRPLDDLHDLFPRARPYEHYERFGELVVVMHVPEVPSIVAAHTTIAAAGCLVVDAVYRLAGAPSLTVVGFDELASVELPDADGRERLDDMVELIRDMQSAVQYDWPIFHAEHEPRTRP
ncbi:uncharacterized protein LOC62_04G005264 [Vanrija pseudolonga]|uniref:Uncharacterized protein n=1 Tax=Vanrija pseudolonga TaxID=143232 RepID=A0AAF0YDY1_9TREE|nr:hypothetical protein LOC62_04G005264 [Vanrija pseudolonga]